MRVLFLSGIDGFCHRYHVLHRAAQLARHEVASTVRSFLDPRLRDDIASHDVLFLYRVPETAMTREVIAEARRRGAVIVGSIDDLIFSPDPDDQPALDHLAPADLALWRRGIERYRATLLDCDAFVGPTQPLVAAAARLGVPAFLHRNSVSAVERTLGARAASKDQRRRVAAATAREADSPIWLGYLSGTPTHDQDFATIAPALLERMSADPRVRLRVVGPLSIASELGPVADRIERVPLLSWTELPEIIAGLDIVLAPLDLRRRFARAKGEVKYLEAASVGRPILASPAPSFEHAIGEGARGRLAADPDAWRNALAELIGDPDLRCALGEAAHADLEQRWDEASRGRELLAVLEQVRSSRGRGSSIRFPLGSRDDGIESPSPARLALEPDAFPLRSDQPAEAISPPLGPGGRLAQRIELDTGALLRLDLFTITYGQALDHRLVVRLRRCDGSTVAEQGVAAADAPDRGWLALDLGPVGLSRGETYVLELEAQSSGASNALSFGLTVDAGGRAGAAELNGVPLAGSLSLRAFAPWAAGASDPRELPRAVEALA